ncbi:DUF4855 domain-containing protein [Parabacteroides chinchillae]|uniref:DUF4855 domain-containing protein n=1 Tax=Parabacteroides chinchillae TaxID=871327 RepID=A0A8G2F1P4_9BACT|nr:DUF4855 domain-containing protein [Parabacteroides chinchillae]SEF97871.1 protein of unknown function [Parabacteroides chinchillae]
MKNVKLLSVIAGLVMMLCVMPETILAIKPFARDMVLIYAGGSHRKAWDKSQFEPYVAMKDGKGKNQWLFDGYLFLEIKNGQGRGFASYYEKEGARRQEWTKLLDDYFTPGQMVCALNDCVGEVRAANPKKFEKKKVVIGMPEPIPNQKDWGEIDGKVMDFSNGEDRLAACQWFVNYAIKKFNEANLDNLELSGFYWIAEEATNSRSLAHNVGDYVRSKGFNFNWIPYFKSDGFQEWKTLGFDIAYLQPNYFFDKKVPFERLDQACKLAAENGMCLEMEFDERALKSGGFGSRLSDYINAFDECGAFASFPIAYYQGDRAFYNLFHSKDIEDKQLYMELAKRIAERQKSKKLKGLTK